MHDPQPPDPGHRMDFFLGAEPWSLALQADSLPLQPPGKPIYIYYFGLHWVFFAAYSIFLAVSGGYPLVAVCRLHVAVASPVAEHRLYDVQASVVAALRLSSCGALA